MRRRDMIAGAGATMFAAPAVAAESTGILAGLPDGMRDIARMVSLPDKTRMLRLGCRPATYASPSDVFTDVVTPNDRFFVRYHLAGVPSAADMDNWSLAIAGDAVDRP